MEAPTEEVRGKCPTCGRPLDRRFSWSCDMGCLMACIGLAILLWAMAGFPAFWK